MTPPLYIVSNGRERPNSSNREDALKMARTFVQTGQVQVIGVYKLVTVMVARITVEEGVPIETVDRGET